MSIPALPERGEIPFRLDGHDYSLPPIPTRAWLDALPHPTPASWWRLLEHLPRDQRDHLLDRLDDPNDPLDIDHLEKNTLTVLSYPLGTDFFAAQRLASFVRNNWMQFDGWMVEHGGVDPLTLPIDRVIAAAYHLQLQGAEKESDQAKIKARIFAPPDGTRASGRRWDEDPDFTRSIDELHSQWFDMALQASR